MHLKMNIGIGFSTIVIFYAVHSWRLAHGSEAARGFASSEINFISAVIPAFCRASRLAP